MILLNKLNNLYILNLILLISTSLIFFSVYLIFSRDKVAIINISKNKLYLNGKLLNNNNNKLNSLLKNNSKVKVKNLNKSNYNLISKLYAKFRRIGYKELIMSKN